MKNTILLLSFLAIASCHSATAPSTEQTGIIGTWVSRYDTVIFTSPIECSLNENGTIFAQSSLTRSSDSSYAVTFDVPGERYTIPFDFTFEKDSLCGFLDRCAITFLRK